MQAGGRGGVGGWGAVLQAGRVRTSLEMWHPRLDAFDAPRAPTCGCSSLSEHAAGVDSVN